MQLLCDISTKNVLYNILERFLQQFARSQTDKNGIKQILCYTISDAQNGLLVAEYYGEDRKGAGREEIRRLRGEPNLFYN